MATVPSYFGAN